MTERERDLSPENKPGRKISDEEMGNLISAFGNHAAKALTLALMQGDGIYTMGDLDNQVRTAQGGLNRGWKMGGTLPWSYCKQSLCPIGLVAWEVLNSDSTTYGYQITSYGGSMLPLAGLLLEFSERHDIALQKIWGNTSSPAKSRTIETGEGEETEFKDRAPITRLKIFFELATVHLPIREVDLVQNIRGVTSLRGLTRHLQNLKRYGLIKYSAIRANTPITEYKLSITRPSGEVPILYRKLKTLTWAVFKVMNENPDLYLTGKDVYDLLPDILKQGWQEKEHLGDISIVISHLQKQGYLEVKKFKYGRRSEIDLSAQQRNMLGELVDLLDKFQNQDPEIIRQGKSHLATILASPNIVCSLLGRAKEASSHHNFVQQEGALAFILSLISSNPAGLTNRQIREAFEKEYEITKSPARISSLTFILESNGSVAVQKNGSIKIYFPPRLI